jgi:prolyl-tRNA editing enzyme YbaK/EbsC (Cys-tRNA(Pro) deacylase)
VVVGTALSGTQLNATAGGVAGSFAYTPAAGTVLTSAGSQMLSVTFTPVDATAYLSATATVTVVVTASGSGGGSGGGGGSAAFVGPSNGGGYTGTVSGGALIYRGVSYPITNGRVFFPDCTNYAVIPGGYLMMGATTPNCTVGGGSGSGGSGGNGGGGGGTTPVAPTITWTTPSAVVVGTALSGTQLNATAGGVAGSFAYTPAAGTVLTSAGSQTLSVTFTPVDTTAYLSATATVTVVVTTSGSGSGSGGGGGSAAFVGPSNGGGYTGTVSGGALIYRGVSYPITNGRVFFPDCTNYAVIPGGYLMMGATTPDCTVGGGSGSGGSGGNGGGGGGTTPVAPTITWTTPSAVVVGMALSATQLNATAGGVAGSFAYTPAAGTVLTSAGSQTLSVTFTPVDTTAYLSATATVTLVVTASGSGSGSGGGSGGGGSPAFVGPSNGGGYTGTVSGGALIYRGVSYPITGGRVFFPDCTNYAVIPGGYLMMGATTPNCTVGGGSGGSGGSGGGGGGTTPVAPTITWTTPSAVVVGTALSGTQLNATAGGVAGSFAYTPAAGTVLTSAGSQTLSVTFTPVDTTAYLSATATVTVVVTASGSGGGSGGGGGSPAFVGPSNGGGYTGTVSGSTLTYRGVNYPIANGRVFFPDCTNYIVAPNGVLFMGQTTAGCSPGV